MKRLSRRQFLVSTAAAAALVGLPGCGGTSGLQDDVVTSDGRLAILNWSEYIDPELLEGVQLQLGLNIDYQELWEDNYGGQDLFGPQWDIVTPTNWLAAQYVRDGSVQRLPVEFIPNHKNIDPVFLTNGWDRGARF
ncbi:MAG: spermidine/putrescine transport system substrate-binding protein, partial [Acidimicrobiales bacterium]